MAAKISYAIALTGPLSCRAAPPTLAESAIRSRRSDNHGTNLPEMPPLRTWAALRYVRGTVFGEIGGTGVARQKLIDLDLKETPTPGYGTMSVKVGFTHKQWNGSLMVGKSAKSSVLRTPLLLPRSRLFGRPGAGARQDVLCAVEIQLPNESEVGPVGNGHAASPAPPLARAGLASENYGLTFNLPVLMSLVTFSAAAFIAGGNG